MRVVKNYLYNASYQVFILIIPLITTPYLSRILGPTGVGINSYTNSIIQYFILFGSIGVSLYGNRQVAFVRNDRQKLTNTFYEIFSMRSVTIVISYVFFIIFLIIAKQYRIYYLAQSISIIAVAFDISWFFMGLENFSVTVLRNFIVKVTTLVCIFAFVKSEGDLTNYILILSLSLLIGNVTLFPSLQRYISRPIIKELRIWQHFRPALLLFIPQVATQIYLVVNKTMLGSMTSVQSAGYFDQSDKMIKMVLAIVTATGTVMLPHVASAFANKEYRRILRYLYKSFDFVTVVSVPMAFGLAAISPKFVPLFFSSRFIEVTPLMMIESIVILLIAWSNVIGTQYLLPTKQVKLYTNSVVWGAVVNIIANIPLIIWWGAMGTALATVLSELIVTGYQVLAIREQVNYKQLFLETPKYLASGLLMFTSILGLNKFLSVSWFSLFIEIFVGILVYCVLLIAFRAKIVNTARDLISK
ncbi:flippase [Levilactobacillus brevis]|uniref:oligosaccharide flippase family protein n=1 Tax=Levilactobacillus brevis TaxID=1580 RepID=UPI0021A5C347|nr:polysaccharide biosynthesis C-terminal domain-containing protein [Levilactobacillus brevis]MCT2887841.1 flippase [Levilactobacillus brevis]